MINRGTGATQAFIWDESNDEFALISTTDSANVYGDLNINSYSNLRLGGLTVSQIKIVDGTQGSGKYLVSDVNGLASWSTPSSQTLEQTLVLGNTVGTQSINFGGFSNISANGTNIELKAEGNISGNLYLNRLTIKDDLINGIEQVSFSLISDINQTSSFSLKPGNRDEGHSINDIFGTSQTGVTSKYPFKTVELLTDQSTGVDTEYRRELGVNGTTNGSLVKVTDNDSSTETKIETTFNTITLKSKIYPTTEFNSKLILTPGNVDLSSEDVTGQHRTGISTADEYGSLDSTDNSTGNAASFGVFVNGFSYVAGSNMSATDGTTSYSSVIYVYPDNIIVNCNNPAFAGMEYGNNYSPYYTNRSLVDKEYVDNATPNLTQVLAVGATANSWINLGQSYGVRETGATGSSVLFNSSRMVLSTGGGGFNSSINLWKNGLLQLSSSNGVDGCIFIMKDDAHSYGTGTVYLDGLAGRGIQYYADYSTGYTNRSLVDKEYVDNATITPSLSDVMTVGNNTTNKNIIFNTYYGLESANGNNKIKFTDDYQTDIINKLFTTGLSYKQGQIMVNSNNGESAMGAVTYDDGIFQQNSEQYAGSSFARTRYSEQDLSTFNYYNTDIETRRDYILVRSEYNTGINSTFQGLIYGHDYSLSYTNRSLVDKEYVDSRLLSGLVDTDGTQTDTIKASIADVSGIYSSRPSLNDNASVQVDSSTGVVIKSNGTNYRGFTSVSQEQIVNTVEEGTFGVTGYKKIDDGLYLQTKQTTYNEDTGYGVDDKLTITEIVINKFFTDDAGSIDLYTEPFNQEAINDYEVDVYIKNNDTYYPQRQYMVWKMKRTCLYTNSNSSIDISPIDTQKFDFNLNPLYDSWDIVRNTTAFGEKWTLNWNFGNSYDFSVSIKIKTTTKKY